MALQAGRTVVRRVLQLFMHRVILRVAVVRMTVQALRGEFPKSGALI